MIHPETRLLVQFLRDAHAAGKMATYTEIKHVTGIDVQIPSNRRRLSTAMKIVQADYGAVFFCLYKVGYKPATPDDIAAKCSDRKRHIKNTAKQWRNELETIDPTTLNQSQMLKYVQSGLELQTIEAATSERVEKAIKSKTVEAYDPLDCYRNLNVMELLGSVG